ncbi:MAG TPA: hypothetical protein VIY47_02045 [Ignavibacteriaceae bacterium]
MKTSLVIAVLVSSFSTSPTWAQSSEAFRAASPSFSSREKPSNSSIKNGKDEFSKQVNRHHYRPVILSPIVVMSEDLPPQELQQGLLLLNRASTTISSCYTKLLEEMETGSLSQTEKCISQVFSLMNAVGADQDHLSIWIHHPSYFNYQNEYQNLQSQYQQMRKDFSSKIPEERIKEIYNNTPGV